MFKGYVFMNLLQEALRNIKRLDNDTELPDDNLTDDLGDDMDIDIDADSSELDDENTDIDIEKDSEMSDDDLSFDDTDPLDDQGDFDPDIDTSSESTSDDSDEDQNEEGTDPESDDGLDNIADEATEDPNKAGVIRKVPNAHLVFKRASEDGGFEELWVYNVGNYSQDLLTKKEILSGTDIPVNKTESEDGKQSYTMWSSGNAEMVYIKGLTN